MKKKIFISTCLLLIGFYFIGSQQQSVDPTKISMEEFFQVKSFRGKSARQISFSNSSRYLAFLWSPYEDFGYDLYIYDTSLGKSLRITSLEKMKKYDPPEDYKKFMEKIKQKRAEDERQQKMYMAQRDYLDGKDVDLSIFEKEDLEKLKKELKKKEAEKKKKEGKKEKKGNQKKKADKKKELETWELRDKLKKKKEEERIKRQDLYRGVTGYKWANRANELIFEYRGDLFRYFATSNKISRLTMSDDSESIIQYTANDKGFYYSNSNKVFQVTFNSSNLFQINHKITQWKTKKGDKVQIANTTISPNDRWMMLVVSKSRGKPAYRQVQIMSFNNRFAKATTTRRQMPDDKRNQPTYRFFLRPILKGNYGKEPQHIFEIKGGDVWHEFSNITWSKDSTMYAFMTWEREKGDLKIWVGAAKADSKPELFFSMKESIGYKSFYYRNLRFTPDNRSLIALLTNKEGFRQPCIFNLKTRIKTSIIKGKFESFPILDFDKTGRYLYILSDKIDPAKHSVFKVHIKSGKMKRIGRDDGMHRTSAISKNGRWLATNFGNWSKRSELYLLNVQNGAEKVITSSHHPQWQKYNFIQPELFKYKNRHGDLLSGMVFKPKGWQPGDARPAIVYMYGGPLGARHTVESDSFHRLAYMFQMIMAAKHGFVTINIDTRGQSGYGRTFNEANWKQAGKPQVEDLEDLVKHISTGFGVDITKVGLHGWSFGGFQTLAALFTSPETFACGIAAAGPTEWENYNSWYTGSTIDESKRGKLNMRKHSLIPLAKNLKRPLLLIHGMLDPNVLYQDTVNVYKALLAAGKETLVDLFLDPAGRHGLGGYIKNKSLFKKYESWFLNHLQ